MWNAVMGDNNLKNVPKIMCNGKNVNSIFKEMLNSKFALDLEH